MLFPTPVIVIDKTLHDALCLISQVFAAGGHTKVFWAMQSQSGQLSASDPGSSGEQGKKIKISQRPARSCTECIRRKTRCNKQIPCDVCGRRGVAHLCRLDPQYVPLEVLTQPARPVADVTAELDALRRSVHSDIGYLKQRVTDLERQIHGTRHGSGQPSQSTEAAGRMSAGRQAPDGRSTEEWKTQLDDPKGGNRRSSVLANEDSATTLEFLSLGMDRRLGAADDAPSTAAPSRNTSPDEGAERASKILVDPLDRPIPDSIVDALLPESNVTLILKFAEEHVLWQHCCIFFPDFWKEVDLFFQTISTRGWNSVEPSWIALLYVVLGIAIHQMSNEEAAKCGLEEADRLVLPNALVSAAEEALYLGSFLSRHNIYTVQAIAILCLCGHNVCESDLLASLLAVAIKTAQTLNLHSLGKVSAQLEREALQTDGPRLMISSRKVIEVELGKRLWWALTQEDWFGIPFRGVWSIHPEHFDTPLPHNCHDADLQAGHFFSRHSSTLTVSLKLRFCAQIATAIQDLFARINSRIETQEPFQSAEEVVDRIQRLIKSLPISLQAGFTPLPSEQEDTLPVWTKALRHYLQISGTHKVLVVYRAFLSRSTPYAVLLTDNKLVEVNDSDPNTDRQEGLQQRQTAHRACIKSAEIIVDELERGSMEPGIIQALWTIPYHALAAAVVLALDMITLRGRGEQAKKRFEDVQRATRGLERLAPTSRIARRGLRVISDLLKEAEQMGQAKRSADDEAIPRMVKRVKLPPNDMAESTSRATSLSPVVSTSSTPRSISSSIRPSAPVPTSVHTAQGTFNPYLTSPYPSQPVPPGLRLSGPIPNSQNPNSVGNAVAGSSQVGANGQLASVSPGYQSNTVNQTNWWSPTDNTGFDGLFDLSQQETNQLLMSLQQSVPSVGKLFDGSVGTFSWGS